MDSIKRLPVKILLSVCLFTLAGSLFAQEPAQWEKDTVDDIAFTFPTPNRSYDSGDASGLIYHEGDVFITLTSIPDTTGRTFATKEDYVKYYTETLAKAVRRLNGKLLEVTDTAYGGIPAHYSRVEVIHPKGGVTHYELMQLVVGSTLQAFSCQYVPTDQQARALRDRFFQSIHIAAETPASGDTAPVGGFPWYLAAMVLVIILLVTVLRRSRQASAQVVLV